MQEDFLYFIWQYRLFTSQELFTTEGKSIKVENPGFLNTNSGPDFSEAQVYVDGIKWAGHVEMHVKSSDWDLHKHQHDPAYNNVILHIVWEHDLEVSRHDNTHMPTLELRDLVTNDLLSRYKQLTEALDPVPCIRQANSVDKIKWLSMLERSMVKRLEIKAEAILDLLKKKNNDWEETTYHLMLRYLGFKVNDTPMELLAEKLPYSLLKKNSHNSKAVESMIFGQAGFLEVTKTDYQATLKKEFIFLSKKYSFSQPVEPHLWKFLRMRPANFPTLRLAQFAAMIQKNTHLFDLFLHEKDIKKLEENLRQPLHSFWKTHYHFNKEVTAYDPRIGAQAIRLLAINIMAPIRAAYSIYTDNQQYMDGALDLLGQLPFEKNKITKAYEDMPFEKRSAFDSQGMIGLYNRYCSKKQCLQCDVGVGLVKA